MRNRLVALIVMAVTLNACGGGDGGGSTPPPANSVPQFSSATSATVAENQSGVVYTATATDANGDALTFSITGGADQSVFIINATTGALSLANAADFEAPADANTDGTYEVVLQVNDGKGGTAPLNLTIAVKDVTQLALHVTYPTDNANLGSGVTTTSVAGYLDDLEDGDVLAGDVDFIDVNGERATLEMGDVVRWRTRVPVAKTLNIQFADTSGHTGQVSQALQNSIPLSFLGSIALDSTRDRALVPFSDAIVAINLVTGERTIVSDDNTGTGPALSFLSRIAVDSAGDRAVVVDTGQDAIFAVDLATGDRTLVSGAGTGSVLDFSSGIALDRPHDRVLITDTNQDAIFAVDLATGSRTILSGSGAGLGDPLKFPGRIIVDTANDRALVADRDLRAVVAVDLTTGDRTFVASPTLGEGPPLNNPLDLALDSAGNRVLVVDNGLRAIIAVDLATGNRTLVSHADRGTGANLDRPRSLVLDDVNGRALVVDQTLDALIAVDLQSGDRTALGGIRSGSGEEFPALFDAFLALDSSRDRILISADGPAGLLAVDSRNGDRTTLSEGPPDSTFSTNRGIALDTSRDRALVVDASSKRVLAVDLATGERSIVSDTSGTGSGTLLSNPLGIAVEASGEHALVVDLGLKAVISIDLTNGDRTVISQAGVRGEGDAFGSAFDLVLDEGRKRALVLDSSKRAIWSVDLDSGDRAILSDATRGSGAPFENIQRIALDALDNRILVTELSFADDPNGISVVLAVDLASGNRTSLARSDVGFGSACFGATSIALDSRNNRAFVMCDVPTAVFVIDLASGERAILSRGLFIGDD